MPLFIESGFDFDGGRELVLKGFTGSTRAYELCARRPGPGLVIAPRA
jgi:hypothetical protein